MKSGTLNRALRFESLETRDLLAGNVLVRLTNGALSVTGDNLDNGLTIERVLDATGKFSLAVTPDATTSINGGPAGLAISLVDFSRDAQVDMFGGNDSVTLIGTNFGDTFTNTALRCSTGTGNDKIQIESWSWGSSIAIDNADGQDEFTFSHVKVGGSVGGSAGGGSGGSITLKSPKSTSLPTVAFMNDVSVTQSSSKLTALTLDTVSATIEDSDFVGAMKYTAAAAKQHYTVKLTNALVTSVSAVQRGGGLDFSADRCAFFDVFVDVESGVSSAAGQVFHNSFSMTDDDCDGVVTLRSVGETDVTVDGTSATDMFLKHYRPTNSAQLSNAKVSLSDLSITRRLSIEGRGGLDVEGEACAAVDFFLKIDNIKGELHRSSLTLTDCPAITHLSLRSTEQTDLSLNRSSFFDVTVDVAKPLSAAPPTEYMKIKLSDCLISSFATVTTTGGGVDVDVDSTRSASWFMKMDTIPGESARATFQDLSITNSFTVQSRGQTDLSLSACKMFDTFIKIDRLSATQLDSSITCVETDVTRRMSIESRGGTAVSLDTCSAVDMFLKLEGVKGELYRSTTSIVDCDATKLSLTSIITADSYRDQDSDGDTVDEDCDLAVTGGSFRDVFFDVSRTATSSSAPSLQIKMADLLVSGMCSVSTKGSTVDADIGSSAIEIASWSFGASNAGSGAVGGGAGSGKVSVHDISVTKSASLSVSGLYDVDVSSLAAVDFFLKLDRTSVSQKLSSVTCADLDLDGRFSFDSRGALDVSLDTCASTDMFIKIDWIKGELSRSSVSIEDSSSSSRLTLTSLTTCDVSLERSSFFDVFLDVTRSASPPGTPYLQIKMEDLLVSGLCSVSTKGGAVEADIGDSTFAGICSWSFGASNPSTVGSGGGGGAGKVSVHDISVTKSVSLSASGLYDVAVSSLSAVDFFLKLDRTSISQVSSSVDCDDVKLSGAMSLQSKGAATVEYRLCYSVDSSLWIEGIKGETLRSSVSISDSSVSSRLSLTSLVTCDVSLEHSSFFDVSSSVTRSASPPGSPAMIFKMNDLLVSGLCTATCVGDVDADIGSSRFDRSLSFSWGLSQTGTTSAGSGLGAGKVNVHDLSVTTSMSLVSRGQTAITGFACTAGDLYMKVDRVTRLADNSAIVLSECAVTNTLSIEGRGGVDLTVTGGRFSKVFAKVESIKGEVHRQTVSFDDVSGSSLRVVSAEPQAFSLTRASFFDVFCDVSVPSSTSPGAALASSTLLEDLTVSGSLSVTTSGGSHVLNVRQCTCPDGYFVQNAPSGRSSATTIEDSSFSSRLSVVTRGENHVSLDACSSFDTYLKFERLTSGQPGASSVSLDGLTLDGALSIDSRGSLDVTASACRAVDMFLKIEGVQGERRSGEIILADFVLDNRMSISSSCPLDLTIDGSFANDIFIKIDRIGTSTDGSRVVVTDTDCDDGFSLSTSSGADIVLLDDVTTHGRAMVSLGAGDDQLTVLDCPFDESSFFDGGTGFDHLIFDAVFAAGKPPRANWDLATLKGA